MGYAKATVGPHTSKDYTVTVSPQGGPPPDGGLVMPLGMRQDCRIKEHRLSGIVFTSSWEVGFTFNVMGDGTITAFPDTDVKIQ